MKAARPSAAAWLLAGLIALLPAHPADAARLWRWRDADGVSHYGDRPPPGAAAEDAQSLNFRRDPGAAVALRLVDRGSHYEAWADNRLPGPTQVQLRLRSGDNITVAPALPARTTVPADGNGLVGRIYPADPRVASSFDLILDYLPGDPHARPLDFEYRLPFDYAQVRVDQGFGGGFSHNDAQNRYAIDFAVPEGTPVLAAREGTVLQVESDFARAGLDRERYGGRANYVRILHADGSMALYAHLKPEGVLVRPGQRVRQGQRIALSGNTGFSTAPHLHFVVQVNRGMRLEAVPIRMFGALGELKFARDASTPAR
ncbi:peptidase [Pseudoxanthomonas broegbernensis]|uniref:Peptidase n=1 Tax=Pseudoxanthomonas broegbernensis TaxID=83619 RepID=A0A7V8GKF0_9GAMM|nr:M23 family metallopeptidase [Pseudoxanthomonas broegbernensis]KAF1685041.1 peptidase [Pseudoxanthomonas broegbernensis]MBB6066381.1 murein DD-endopeptidase MepM/ murein hydrolase activator NlpD [Pseudoxanthomonas broegbernensis]